METSQEAKELNVVDAEIVKISRCANAEPPPMKCCCTTKSSECSLKKCGKCKP